MMDTQWYGHGVGTDVSKRLKKELTTYLDKEIKEFKLKVSVRKAKGGYGGPMVSIQTADDRLSPKIKVVVDGTFVIIDRKDFDHSKHERWGYGEEENENRNKLHQKIEDFLMHFGHDDSDIQSDYFYNTRPLFWGIAIV